jgi:hypothetical protein
MSKDWWDDSPLHPANQPDDETPKELVLDDEEIEALAHVVLYLHEEERKDQEECGCQDHMFFNIDKLKNALNSIDDIDMDHELKIYNNMSDEKQEE